MEGAQKFKAKVYFGGGQVPAGRAQPKEQTVGAKGTTTRFVMAAQPQGCLCHVRHCSRKGAGKNLGLQPRAPTLQGGARQQTPHERVPTAAYVLPWPGLALTQGWPGCKDWARRLKHLFGISPLSPSVRKIVGERKRNRKARREDRQRRASSAHSLLRGAPQDRAAAGKPQAAGRF